MILDSPLRRRVVLSFLLLTLVVSGLFAIAIDQVFHFIEAHLISDELDEKLQVYSQLGAEDRARLDGNPETRYFSSAVPAAIPPHVATARYGLTEIEAKGHDAFIYRKRIAATDYYVVKDQQVIERYENMIRGFVISGFVLSLLVSALVGWWIANRLLSPVSRLAEAVAHSGEGQRPPALLAELHQRYPNDEIGLLAQVFAQTLGKLNAALARERSFTTDISHELRTSLMVLSSSNDLLLRGLSPDGKPYRDAEQMQQAILAMQQLVQTFLLLARADRQETPAGPGVTLLEAANQQHQAWQQEFAAKGLDLQLDIASDVTAQTARYHSHLLDTVLSNLLRNALQYTEHGTVSISVQAQGFAVSDTGIGIPEEVRERIFEEFFSTATDTLERLGVGLSLTQRICAHQGWHISVAANQPQGSIFRVTLG